MTSVFIRRRNLNRCKGRDHIETQREIIIYKPRKKDSEENNTFTSECKPPNFFVR